MRLTIGSGIRAAPAASRWRQSGLPAAAAAGRDQVNVHLDGRIPAAVEHLAGVDGADLVGSAHGSFPPIDLLARQAIERLNSLQTCRPGSTVPGVRPPPTTTRPGVPP